MIGLDTNILVRYLTQDEPKQAALAAKLIETLTTDEPGFISHVVLVETLWVLESCYAAGPARVQQVVDTLLRTGGIVVDRAESVWRALGQFREDAGNFADTLIAVSARAAGCSATFTFDKGAAKRSGMKLLA
ncbi:MAG: PIN domain-containing protein [Rhodanobacteraceae bacterium]|nr:MAG: PIN domain-containing protein [Rhodanobacteraceae bacterium]